RNSNAHAQTVAKKKSRTKISRRKAREKQKQKKQESQLCSKNKTQKQCKHKRINRRHIRTEPAPRALLRRRGRRPAALSLCQHRSRSVLGTNIFWDPVRARRDLDNV